MKKILILIFGLLLSLQMHGMFRFWFDHQKTMQDAQKIKQRAELLSQKNPNNRRLQIYLKSIQNKNIDESNCDEILKDCQTLLWPANTNMFERINKAGHIRPIHTPFSVPLWNPYAAMQEIPNIGFDAAASLRLSDAIIALTSVIIVDKFIRNSGNNSSLSNLLLAPLYIAAPLCAVFYKKNYHDMYSIYVKNDKYYDNENKQKQSQIDELHILNQQQGEEFDEFKTLTSQQITEFADAQRRHENNIERLTSQINILTEECTIRQQQIEEIEELKNKNQFHFVLQSLLHKNSNDEQKVKIQLLIDEKDILTRQHRESYFVAKSQIEDLEKIRTQLTFEKQELIWANLILQEHAQRLSQVVEKNQSDVIDFSGQSHCGVISRINGYNILKNESMENDSSCIDNLNSSSKPVNLPSQHLQYANNVIPPTFPISGSLNTSHGFSASQLLFNKKEEEKSNESGTNNLFGSLNSVRHLPGASTPQVTRAVQTGLKILTK